MAATNKVTSSSQPINRRPSSAQRLAAQSETLAGKQAQLKQEAAERRELRASKVAAGATTSRRVAAAKLNKAR